jgi:hypothetical protein
MSFDKAARETFLQINLTIVLSWIIWPLVEKNVRRVAYLLILYSISLSKTEKLRNQRPEVETADTWKTNEAKR